MEKANQMKILQMAFLAVVIVASGLTAINYVNYLGMLKSMDEVIFTIDSVTHSLEESKVEFTINFTVLNPTSYGSLDFSSLQCQVYLLDDEGGEQFLGATGYAPPVDIPLNPGEPRVYTTQLSVSSNNVMGEGDVVPTLLLRFRNVIHFQTPLRRYYQSIYLDVESHVG